MSRRTVADALGAPRRGPVVLIAAALAVGLLVAASRPWVVVALADPLAGTERLEVAGTRAAPVVAALGLVALACAAALTLARRVGSAVALSGLAIAALGTAAVSIVVLVSPGQAARTAVAEATGLTAASVDPGAVGAQATGWPVVAAVLALMLLGAALAGARGRRGWQAARRIDPTGEPAPAAAEEWDALTRGEDPTREG